MARSVAAGYRADDPTSTLSAVFAGRPEKAEAPSLPAGRGAARGAVQASGAWIGTRLAIRFLALTAARRGEVRGARWRPLRDLKIDCSPHGFRSSFRSWCSDEGIDRELAEQALAHAVGSQVEQCYARSDVLERRREVMEAWGAFLVQ